MKAVWNSNIAKSQYQFAQTGLPEDYIESQFLKEVKNNGRKSRDNQKAGAY